MSKPLPRSQPKPKQPQPAQPAGNPRPPKKPKMVAAFDEAPTAAEVPTPDPVYVPDVASGRKD